MNNIPLVLTYAVIGAVSVVVGIFITGLLGMQLSMGYVSGAIAGASGGAAGGWIRQKKR